MKVFLKPGEVFMSREPAIVSTILGSCLAITVFSKRLKAGGICHALLPESQSPRDKEQLGRFVDSAFKYILRRLETMGVEKNEMQVKIFGGGDVLDILDAARPSVGRQNIERAVEVIKREGLTVFHSDIGGRKGRFIRFDTQTGVVFLKRIESITGIAEERIR